MRDNPLWKNVDRWLGIPLCYLTGLCVRKRSSSVPSDPQNILIIKLTAVGDSILAVPAWRALHNFFTGAKFTILCSSVTYDTVRTFPFFDEILKLDLERLVKPPTQLLSFIADLRRRRFDLVIDYDQWMRTTALISLATGARHRLGFDTRDQHRRYCYTHSLRPVKNRHEVDNFLDLAELTGAPRGSRDLELWIPDEDQRWARAILCAEGRSIHRIVAIHPGCGGAGQPRQWPPELYAELGNRVRRKFDDVQLVLTGSPGEKPLVENIAGKLQFPCLKLTGPYSITQFAALLKQCALLVCGNTGSMHIAAAVGTPTVALHGPTNPNKWGPVGNQHIVVQSPIACSPCLDLGFDYGCSTHPCMRMITVDRVYEAVVSLLCGGMDDREYGCGE